MDTIETRSQLDRVISEIREDAKSKASRGDLAALDERFEDYKRDMNHSIKAMRDAVIESNRYEATGAEAELRYYIDSAEDMKGARRGAYLTGADSEKGLRLFGTPTEKGWSGFGLLDDPEPVHEWQHKLQKAVTKRSIVKAMIGYDMPTRRCDREVRRVLRNAPGVVQKIFTDSASGGAEWIGDITVPELEREVYSPLGVAALFATRQLPASGTLKIPQGGFGIVPYMVGKNTSEPAPQYTSSTPTSGDREITAVGLGARVVVDAFSAEDMVIDAYDAILDMMADALRMGREDSILNGDTGTHGDTGLSAWNIRSYWAASMGGSNDHRRRFIGLRQRAIDLTTHVDQGSAQTAAGIAALRAQLGARGALSCAVITSPEYALKTMITFDEIETGDKAAGPNGLGTINAPVGSVPVFSLYGMPVVISDFMDIELNASGVFDNSTKTKTGALVVARDRFEIGVRRGMTLEREKDITRQTWNMVATLRDVLSPKGISNEKNVAYGYNLTP